MTDDTISREAAKAAIKSRTKGYEIAPNGSFEHGVYQGLRMAINEVAALDALPSAGEPAERWAKLEHGVRELGGKWGARGINERQFGTEPCDSPSDCCRNELDALIASLTSTEPKEPQ